MQRHGYRVNLQGLRVPICKHFTRFHLQTLHSTAVLSRALAAKLIALFSVVSDNRLDTHFDPAPFLVWSVGPHPISVEGLTRFRAHASPCSRCLSNTRIGVNQCDSRTDASSCVDFTCQMFLGDWSRKCASGTPT